MHPRVRFVLIGGFVCCLALLGGLWLAAYKRAGSSTLERSDAFAGSVRPAAAMVPPFTLRDQDGKTVTAATLRGSPTIYAFIYSHCQDICPLEVQQIRGAMDRLGHDVPVVGVSVDPVNDTADSARAFMIKEHMTGRMRYLLGTRAQLQPLWQAFGIRPQLNGKQDHSAYVVVVDASGRQRLGYPSSQLTVEGLADDLAKLT